MATLCRPAIAVPEYTISKEETLQLAAELHAGNPDLPLALQLVGNTGVQKRHLIQPLDVTLCHPGFEERNKVYLREARARIPEVVQRALEYADVVERDIDLIIYVSCTGFAMPSMTAWIINELDFKSSTRQLPIAQLGCAAGGAAINRAHDFCAAYPAANVLIVACEFCSLCYQPDDLGVGSLLSNGLFGDAIGAAVVRGEGGRGVRLERNGSWLVPDTESWISYAVKDTGFHFQLDKRVPHTMSMLAPSLAALADELQWNVSALDFYIIHAGGPRILDDLSELLEVDGSCFRHSRATLTEYGNIASVVVLDALARKFEESPGADLDRGIIAGFGPGITAEISMGTWVTAGVEPRSGIEESFVRVGQDLIGEVVP